MIQRLVHTDAIAYDELSNRAFDAEFDSEFPANGNFQKVTRKTRDGVERAFWYYYGYDRAGAEPGRKYSKYAGPADEPAIAERVERFARLKTDHAARKRMVAQLKGAGLTAPQPIEGEVIKALADEGVFRMRALIVGSLAFQAYPGMLGVRLPNEAMRTTDVDFAQDHGISISIDDTTGNLFEVLKRVDPSFRAVPHISDRTNSNAFENRDRFKVEFLTANRGADTDKLTRLPSLGDVGAAALRHLDFLIRDPIRGVLLHGSGISVRVPQPERYAVHKIIVSALRGPNSTTKSDKDLDQAASLIEAHDATRRGHHVAGAWMEAWERGPAWQLALAQGAMRLPDDALAILDKYVALASSSHGFEDGQEPRRLMSAFAGHPRARP